MSEWDTHLIVCKNPDALKYLIEDSCLIGLWARDGKPMSQGDALYGRNTLEEAGFRWGKDFYLKKV